jgi:hypothetical protein
MNIWRRTDRTKLASHDGVCQYPSHFYLIKRALWRIPTGVSSWERTDEIRIDVSVHGWWDSPPRACRQSSLGLRATVWPAGLSVSNIMRFPQGADPPWYFITDKEWICENSATIKIWKRSRMSQIIQCWSNLMIFWKWLCCRKDQFRTS